MLPSAPYQRQGCPVIFSIARFPAITSPRVSMAKVGPDREVMIVRLPELVIPDPSPDRGLLPVYGCCCQAMSTLALPALFPESHGT